MIIAFFCLLSVASILGSYPTPNGLAVMRDATGSGATVVGDVVLHENAGTVTATGKVFGLPAGVDTLYGVAQGFDCNDAKDFHLRFGRPQWDGNGQRVSTLGELGISSRTTANTFSFEAGRAFVVIDAAQNSVLACGNIIPHGSGNVFPAVSLAGKTAGFALHDGETVFGSFSGLDLQTDYSVTVVSETSCSDATRTALGTSSVQLVAQNDQIDGFVKVPTSQVGSLVISDGQSEIACASFSFCGNEVDTNEHCSSWAAQRYCSNADFPGTRVACPQSCCGRFDHGVTGNTLPPPPAVCDLPDSNRKCPIWRDLGFCESLLHFKVVGALCPTSCCNLLPVLEQKEFDVIPQSDLCALGLENCGFMSTSAPLIAIGLFVGGIVVAVATLAIKSRSRASLASQDAQA